MVTRRDALRCSRGSPAVSRQRFSGSPVGSADHRTGATAPRWPLTVLLQELLRPDPAQRPSARRAAQMLGSVAVGATPGLEGSGTSRSREPAAAAMLTHPATIAGGRRGLHGMRARHEEHVLIHDTTRSLSVSHRPQKQDSPRQPNRRSYRLGLRWGSLIPELWIDSGPPCVIAGIACVLIVVGFIAVVIAMVPWGWAAVLGYGALTAAIRAVRAFREWLSLRWLSAAARTAVLVAGLSCTAWRGDRRCRVPTA